MEEARMTSANPLYLGCLMVKAGDADGRVAGALNTTGNVLRAAFQVIKTMPGIDVVSGAFVMVLPEGSPLWHKRTADFCRLCGCARTRCGPACPDRSVSRKNRA